MKWHIILTVAKKELVANIKNYWIIVVALVSYILNFSIVHFSVSFAGFENQGNPQAIMLSLIHLQMYVLSLFALILSYDGMLKEKELGTLELLLSFPLRSSDLVIGKWIGYSAVLLIATLLGFLPISYTLVKMGIPFSSVILFIGYSIWLGLTFTSLGLFLSSLAKDRTFVIAICIIFWVFLVFIFDIVFTMLAVSLNGIVSNGALSWILLFNPVDVFRISSLLTFMHQAAVNFYGLDTGVLKLRYLFVAMFLWFLVPLFITAKKKRV